MNEPDYRAFQLSWIARNVPSTTEIFTNSIEIYHRIGQNFNEVFSIGYFSPKLLHLMYSIGIKRSINVAKSISDVKPFLFKPS